MSEWKEYKLGDAPLEIIDGDRGKNYPTQDEFYSIEHTLFLSTRNVRKTGFDFQECQFITKDKDEKLRKGKLTRYDLVLTTRGTVGNLGYYGKHIKFENIRINSGMVIIRPKTDVLDPLFNFYIFRFLQSDFETFSSGSAQPQLPIRDMKDIPILLPPLAEQKAIAGVLSALDDKIDLLHRQNKTLEAMAETLFRQWFVEGAEESWEEGKLGDEFIITMGQSPPGESYNEEGLGIPMYQGNADFEFRFPKNRVFTTDPKRFANKYDALISVRAPVGAQNMANENCCIGRGVASLRYKLRSELYSYTYYKIRYHMFEIAGFNDTGTVFGSIGKDDLWNIKTFIPSLLESEEIDSRLKPLNDRLIENCFQIRSLEKLRDTLLPKLMSGEVRVEV
ncbi:restriction endonuclease subunit S [Leptospira meyeri]|uniref:restriction endonuclease subunit S n=1 Tax=Leptospira meyeri TaxID=29508 RepID=UPI0010845377|nr:restriction endonuclease subunit S [Leptospira meyeri]TGL13508.1 restriction endonuclease subunit S [Leptospira meyeri]